MYMYMYIYHTSLAKLSNRKAKYKIEGIQG